MHGKAAGAQERQPRCSILQPLERSVGPEMGPRMRQISSIRYLPAALGMMLPSRSMRRAVGLDTLRISAASVRETHDGVGRAASARRAASSAIASASDSVMAIVLFSNSETTSHFVFQHLAASAAAQAFHAPAEHPRINSTGDGIVTIPRAPSGLEVALQRLHQVGSWV